jgi:hypothetical protein
LSKAAGEEGPQPGAATAGDENGDDPTTTQMFYVFNPPTQTYEPVTIISLGEEEEEEPRMVIEDMVEQVLQEAEESILPTSEQQELKEELMDGFEQDVEREEIVSADSATS